MSWQNYNPENNLNPNDNIGLFHNNLLVYLVANINQVSNEPDEIGKIIIDISNLIIPESANYLGITPDFNEKNQTFAASCASVICGDNNIAPAPIFLQTSDFSIDLQNTCNEIMNICK
jgi:hypothetical protein